MSVPPFDPSLSTADGNFTIGVCDDEEKTIYVANNLSKFLLKKVLCHELVHAAMFSYNIDLTIEEEELIADLIATHGNEIIQNTEQIFKKIKGAYFK